MYDNPPQAGIVVTTKFIPLAFLLLFFRPKIHVDGGPPVAAPWGTTFFPVYPGRHTVRGYLPYLFFPYMGDNSIGVEVAAGQVVGIRWRAPWLVILKGKWTVEGVRPMLPGDGAGALPSAQAPQIHTTPAGWHPDPHTRHEMRYWDGTAWTANVSDHGATGIDPV